MHSMSSCLYCTPLLTPKKTLTPQKIDSPTAHIAVDINNVDTTASQYMTANPPISYPVTCERLLIHRHNIGDILMRNGC